MATGDSLSFRIERMGLKQKDYFLWVMMCRLLLRHPLPWKIEWDWDNKINDLNNEQVIAFPKKVEAEQFIRFAEDFHEEQKENWEEIAKELGIKIE